MTKAVTSFTTPTTNSGPIGAAPGSDGNVWFGENSVAKVGRVGVGAPAAVQSAPAVTGTPQSGQTLTCQAATFSPWAGQLPTFGFGFDGFRWLLDGRLDRAQARPLRCRQPTPVTRSRVRRSRPTPC